MLLKEIAVYLLKELPQQLSLRLPLSTGGRLVDIITAVLAGTIGYLVVEILDRKLHAQFIPEFIGSLVIGIISVIGHAFVLAEI